jgi:hypothetical protein
MRAWLPAPWLACAGVPAAVAGTTDTGFTAHDGKGHRMCFEPGRKDGTLVVQSRRSCLTALIDKFPKGAKSRPHKAAAEAARRPTESLSLGLPLHLGALQAGQAGPEEEGQG